jgi:hypothetical protein
MATKLYRKYTSNRFQLILDSLRGQKKLYIDGFDKTKSIFIHIPKAAGSSIAHSIYDEQPGHYQWDEYKLISNKKFEKYYKFSFVRHPFDRIFSAYSYLKSGGGNKYDKAFSDKFFIEIINFDQFIDKIYNEQSYLDWIHFVPQHKFICDKHGHLMIDYLARFENINDGFNEIASTLNIKATLGFKNKTKIINRDNSCSDSSEAKIRELYKKDFELFDYE